MNFGDWPDCGISGRAPELKSEEPVQNVLIFCITPFSIRRILPRQVSVLAPSGYHFSFSPTLIIKEDHDEQFRNVARTPRFSQVTLFSF
jgi:hypothetical protein